MAKIGNVVDAETAFNYAKAFTQNTHHLKTRSVIWSKEKAENAVKASSYKTPPVWHSQRDLLHLVCDELDMIYFLCIPIIFNSQWAGLSIVAGRCDYQISKEVDFSIGLRFAVTATENQRQNLLRSRSARTFTEWVEAKIYSSKSVNEMNDTELEAIHVCGALEHFAFSPLATYRNKPTLRHMVNSADFPRQSAPIEIINLRLPQKTDHPESTGRSINLRFPVVEHWRKIADRKTGNERFVKVREHWRGPEDAPIKPHTEKVYKVTR